MISQENISSCSRHVRQLFRDAIAELERRPSPHFQNHHDLSASPRANDTKAIDVNDALERFTLWAGNTGALLSPTSRLSLDSRLAAAPETLDRVCEVLNDLADAIADCKRLLLAW